MHRVQGGQNLSAWKLGGANFECIEMHQNASFSCNNMKNLQNFCLRRASSNGFLTLTLAPQGGVKTTLHFFKSLNRNNFFLKSVLKNPNIEKNYNPSRNIFKMLILIFGPLGGPGKFCQVRVDVHFFRAFCLKKA